MIDIIHINDFIFHINRLIDYLFPEEETNQMNALLAV